MKAISSGTFGSLHCQGIAVDLQRGYIYYSFTTKFVKSDLLGNVLGTVDGIVGHLGCIDFHEEDGKVYGSLEYKNDEIGRGVRNALGIGADFAANAFYVAIFDVDKIDRLGMDAEKDGVMRAVYLPTVVADFGGTTVQGGRELAHIHGCGGMDGIAWGPDFGAGQEGEKFLHIAYGIRSDLSRTDNDYQVFVQYDARDWWETLAAPLSQSAMHRKGPDKPRRKYFAYTGNTTWGVQNMEYDAYTGDYFLCVYRGQKPQFPNYPMFVLDGSRKAEMAPLRGYDPEEMGLTLSLRDTGEGTDGIFGMTFPHGSTGFFAAGDGTYFVSEPFSTPEGEQGTRVFRYRLDRTDGKWSFVREE
jgi:hypothetical protein